ncbi:MAG TPA: hypothetical protein VJR92_02405, partial [Gemmatimonadaceae bacterium]|nr:hypothetical protein [Gemmatimonadaceae bacterium]
LVLASACSSSDDTPVPPAITMVVDSTSPLFGAIDVAPLGARTRAALEDRATAPEDWLEFFAVFAGDSASLSDSSVAVLGDYSVTPDGARFIPRFRAVAGQTYTARFDSKGLRRFLRASREYPNLLAQFSVPRDSLASRTSIVALYPATDSVPMNWLRFYIEFSAPMSVGESRSRVRLLDDRGRAVPDAFLTVAGNQELWDETRQRLTILFDPGRIKRDLNPNETLGLPLRAGNRYRLVVDSGWKDAAGKPILRGFEKRFRVGPIDRGLPRVASWNVTAPAVMTRDPLVVAFREPMDHALASRMLAVKYRDGRSIDGTIELFDHDTRWRFTPRALWGTGPHYIEVDTELEDLAGNSLQRLFDVAPGDTASRGTDSATVRVPFTPRNR